MCDSTPPIKAVVFDLDGTILDTENLCVSVARQVVKRYGKALTAQAIKEASGKRPLDAWRDIVKVLEIDVDPQVLLDESEPMLSVQWGHASLLPGAMRLLQHLADANVTLAVATSTPRATFDAKMRSKPQLRKLLGKVVCGDEVPRGKPAPDIFLAAAAAVGVAPENCLVIEDAPSGVQGASAAGMRVVVVPSIVDATMYPQADENNKSGVVAILPSLMAFRPENFALPPCADTIVGVIPMDSPICIRGTVVQGFGRGSRELGIPTANIDADSLHSSLSEAVTGVYAGWVSLGESKEVYKTALSIGWNPHFGNKQKTCEPWILHTFEQPFYGVEIRLLVVGYVRPEAKFVSLQALIDRIKEDGEVSKAALDDSRMTKFKSDPFLKPQHVHTA